VPRVCDPGRYGVRQAPWETRYPIADWFDADVLAYLGEVGAPVRRSTAIVHRPLNVRRAQHGTRGERPISRSIIPTWPLAMPDTWSRALPKWPACCQTSPQNVRPPASRSHQGPTDDRRGRWRRARRKRVVQFSRDKLSVEPNLLLLPHGLCEYECVWDFHGICPWRDGGR
jgi:hypothetical protein